MATRDQILFRKIWSGRLDSNQRPLAPEASALANCATPRILSLGTCHLETVEKLTFFTQSFM